jgi:capsular polysaccharide biosynthesis protein
MNNNENNSDFGFSSFNLFGYILKKLKFLTVVAIAAAIVSAAASFLITPKYKSKVIFFPAASTPLSQVLLTDYPTNKNIEGFGEEEEAEQVLQILNSDVIKDKIISKYNLQVHYDIKADSKTKKTELYKGFESNASFRRTEFNSIEISILDSDPQMAADMANDISDLIDTVMNNIRKDRVKQALNIVETEYNAYQSKVNLMEDSINILRKKGINDYEVTVDRLTEGYSKALINNNTNAAEKIDNRLKAMSPSATVYVSLRERLKGEYGKLINLRSRYVAMRVEVEQMLPTKFVVDRAYPADKKSYPIRSLIVILSVLSSLILGIIAALIFDNWKYLKSQIA